MNTERERERERERSAVNRKRYLLIECEEFGAKVHCIRRRVRVRTLQIAGSFL